MSKNYLELLLETMRARLSILRSWREAARRVATLVREVYPGARVYVTGSVARGEWIAASDIDIIVVLDHEPSPREASELISYVWERLNLPPQHPLEIHVVGPRGLERYRRSPLIEIR